jgi:hypothetical protein
MDTLFKITHAGTFNTSLQALSLIFQVCQSRAAVSDRFYRTLYDSLHDERLMTSSKQAMYLNMLFKALKADTNQARVMAFVKRLLQMLGIHQPPFICGALYLLGEVSDTVFAGIPLSDLSALCLDAWTKANAYRARGRGRRALCRCARRRPAGRRQLKGCGPQARSEGLRWQEA